MKRCDICYFPWWWKTLVSKDLLNAEYKASVKISEFDLMTFIGISESWHTFDESRFNVSSSTSAFEILLNLKYLFVSLTFIAMILGWLLYCYIDLAIGSSIWSLFTDLSWYFGIFRFETTLIKNLLRASATLSFLSKIKTCSTNVIYHELSFFQKKKGFIDFQKVLLSVTFSWSRLL